jgi:cell division protein FtsZ
MTVPGLINVDFADVRTIMASMGRALMGTGIGTGKKRATEAAEMAISSPLLEDVNIEGATGILINITGGPDLTLHEVNEASSLIQQAAHEDANIIFGSVIDPNLSEEVRITVIATGFDRASKTEMIVERAPVSQPSGPTKMRLSSTLPPASQIQLPYDVSTQTTREYPAPTPPRASSANIPMPRQAAHVVDEVEMDVSWASDQEVSEVERALSELAQSIPHDEHSQRLATGSAPNAVEGAPLVQPNERKRAQSRPSMKTVLSGELDTDSELDVPAFIRRQSTHT